MKNDKMIISWGASVAQVSETNQESLMNDSIKKVKTTDGGVARIKSEKIDNIALVKTDDGGVALVKTTSAVGSGIRKIKTVAGEIVSVKTENQ
jgi:hypothetical protein